MMTFTLLITILLLTNIYTAWLLAFNYRKYTKQKPILKRIYFYFFYFRWFLIGRYHCNTTPPLRKFYNMLNKLFWGLVIISITLLFAQLIQFINQGL